MSTKAVLSIAGFDPSAGAGVLSDVKTFEALGVLGFGVQSALTYQSDTEFVGLEWLSLEQIENQLKPLFKRFTISHAKIGLVEDLHCLLALIDILKAHNAEMQIVWDPIVKASAGFEFHQEFSTKIINQLLKKMSLLTPNAEEVAYLIKGAGSIKQKASELSFLTNVLLKGGHLESSVQNSRCDDILFSKGQETILEGERFSVSQAHGSGKHGSGCVLSAAISAFLFKGFNLKDACKEAKAYVALFLQSSDFRLGFHRRWENKL